MSCKPKTLQKAFDDYLKDEVLKKSTNYKCEKCKKKVTCRIINGIVKLPKYTIFLLKRFDLERRAIHNQFVKYPESISLADQLSPGGKEYVLQSLVQHLGSNRGGHYISF